MKKIMFLIMALMLVGCKVDSPETISEEYLFETDDLGFVADIADVPTNYADANYGLVNTVGAVPVASTAGGGFSDPGINAYWLTVDNHSDDAFNYIYKKLEGLTANTTFKGTLTVKGMTPYDKNSMGIGGSPASSVFVKAGVISADPVPTTVPTGGVDYYRITTFDKGNQSNSGADLATVGTLADDQIAIEGTEYFKVNYTVEVEFTTDTDGNAYIVVGYDSGFEGVNIFGITEIKLDATEEIETDEE